MEAICEIYSRMPFAFQTELPPLRGSFTKQVLRSACDSDKHNCEAMKLQGENNFAAGCMDESSFDENNDYMADKSRSRRSLCAPS